MAGNSNSGRKAKPLHLKVVEGTASASDFAAAQAASDALPTEVPPCPSHLTGPARHEWFRITKLLERLHLVTALDRNELAVYCQAWADWKFAREKIAAAYAADRRACAESGRDASLAERGYVDGTPSGYKQISVWQQIAARAEASMRTSAAHFVFTPATRARLLEAARQPGLFDGADASPQQAAASYFTR